MNDLLTTTMILKPRRVFHCDKENKMLDREHVWKDHEGRYHCTGCSDLVRDVTDTETGKWCLKFMML